MIEIEINTAVAKAMGWKRVFPCLNSYDDGNHLRGTNPEGEPNSIVPNFFNDLNACREMRQSLSVEERKAYVLALGEEVCAIADGTIHDYVWAEIDADSPMHCRAFLRTKNLWKD